MNRYELLRKCHGAALLLKDAQKKLDAANRHLSLPAKKPLGVAYNAHSSQASPESNLKKSVSTIGIGSTARSA